MYFLLKSPVPIYGAEENQSGNCQGVYGSIQYYLVVSVQPMYGACKFPGWGGDRDGNEFIQ